MKSRKTNRRCGMIWLFILLFNFSLAAQISSNLKQSSSISGLKEEMLTLDFTFKNLILEKQLEKQKKSKTILIPETTIMPINEIAIRSGYGLVLRPSLLFSNLSLGNGGYLGPLVNYYFKGTLEVILGVYLNFIKLKL